VTTGAKIFIKMFALLGKKFLSLQPEKLTETENFFGRRKKKVSQN